MTEAAIGIRTHVIGARLFKIITELVNCNIRLDTMILLLHHRAAAILQQALIPYILQRQISYFRNQILLMCTNYLKMSSPRFIYVHVLCPVCFFHSSVSISAVCLFLSIPALIGCNDGCCHQCWLFVCQIVREYCFAFSFFLSFFHSFELTALHDGDV